MTAVDVTAGIRAAAAAGDYDTAAVAWSQHLADEWDAARMVGGAWSPEWSKRVQAAEQAAHDWFVACVESGNQAAVESLVAAWLAEGRGAA